jgi:hypothetical protein
VTSEQIDAEAADVAGEIVGDDVLASLANASRRHDVRITVIISPNDESQRDDVD